MSHRMRQIWMDRDQLRTDACVPHSDHPCRLARLLRIPNTSQARTTSPTPADHLDLWRRVRSAFGSGRRNTGLGSCSELAGGDGRAHCQAALTAACGECKVDGNLRGAWPPIVGLELLIRKLPMVGRRNHKIRFRCNRILRQQRTKVPDFNLEVVKERNTLF